MVYPSPVWCVGTYDAKGEPNVMTASWGGICCSQPPAVTVSLRKEKLCRPGRLLRHGQW